MDFIKVESQSCYTYERVRPAARLLTDSWYVRLSYDRTELFSDTFESLCLKNLPIFFYEGERNLGDLESEIRGDSQNIGSLIADG